MRRVSALGRTSLNELMHTAVQDRRVADAMPTVAGWSLPQRLPP